MLTLGVWHMEGPVLAVMMMASLIIFSSLHLGFLAFYSLKQHLSISPHGLDLRHPLKTRSPRKCYWRCGPSKRWSLVEGSLVIREHFREHLNPAPSFGFSFRATASWEASSVTHRCSTPSHHLPKAMGSSSHELRLLKSWTAMNLPSF